MGREIERKFLVRGEAWRAAAGKPRRLVQGYLALDAARAVVRVRLEGGGGVACGDGGRGFLTVKGKNAGIVRAEYEYEIPAAEARELLALCAGVLIVKERYEVPAGDGLIWEIDVFGDAHDGLVIAEIELPHEDTPFARPDWLGAEVSGDRRYYNVALAAGSLRPRCGGGDDTEDQGGAG